MKFLNKGDYEAINCNSKVQRYLGGGCLKMLNTSRESNLFSDVSEFDNFYKKRLRINSS